MNHKEIVKLLLENNCNPNICNIYNESSLGVAIQEGHLDVVKLLLEYNCDTTWNKRKDTDHDSPLFLALERLNALARLDVLAHLNTDRSNHYEVVELLLHKCDPNIFNEDGQSPLHVAVEHRYKQLILSLLQANANPNLQDKEGRTPLHIALEADDTESDDTAADDTESDDTGADDTEADDTAADDTESYDTAADDTESDDTAAYVTEAVKLLLEHGADPDIYDNEHCTPVLIASKHGRMAIIKLLLQYKCNPYICNNDNELPCLVAYQWGHEDIGDLLVNTDYPL
jgi:ankyrin repeat protein